MSEIPWWSWILIVYILIILPLTFAVISIED